MERNVSPMPATADLHSDNPNPSHSPAAIARDAATVLYLGETLGLTLDSTLAQRALIRSAEVPDTEPMERLVASAEVVGIRLQVFRQSLGDALWMARDEQPLLVWQGDPGGWVLLRKHGFFRVKICTPGLKTETEVISRRALVKRLGLSALSEVVELAVATPERPAEGVRGHGGHQTPALLPTYHVQEQSAGGHHAHVSPIRRFMGLIQPEMKDVWTLATFSVITGLLYLALPLAVNALVSNLAFGTQSAPFQQALLVIALALFAFLLLSAVIRGLQYYVAEVIQRRIFVRVAADMAYRLPRVKADSLDGVHAPEMVNRFLDVVTVQKSTALLLLDGINLVLGGFILASWCWVFIIPSSWPSHWCWCWLWGSSSSAWGVGQCPPVSRNPFASMTW